MSIATPAFLLLSAFAKALLFSVLCRNFRLYIGAYRLKIGAILDGRYLLGETGNTPTLDIRFIVRIRLRFIKTIPAVITPRRLALFVKRRAYLYVSITSVFLHNIGHIAAVRTPFRTYHRTRTTNFFTHDLIEKARTYYLW